MSLLHAAETVPTAPVDGEHLLVPFQLSMAPIARIALMDFSGDVTYRGLEVQRIDDPGGAGEGTVVLMARLDGATDVYFEPHLELDRAGYEWVSNGLAGWFATVMSASHFEVTPMGLQLDIRFALADGRDFDLRIHERSSERRMRFTLLAPAGHGSANPTFLPVFWLPNTTFVRRRASSIDVRIGGQRRPLVRAPIPWKRARYCAGPVLGVWNEQHDGPLAAVPITPGSHHIPDGAVEVVQDQGAPALREIAATCGPRRLAVLHEPPIPSLGQLHDAALLKGCVTVPLARGDRPCCARARDDLRLGAHVQVGATRRRRVLRGGRRARRLDPRSWRVTHRNPRPGRPRRAGP